MNSKTIILAAASIILLIGFFVISYQMTNKPQVTSFPQLQELRARENIKWSKEKKNIIIEYSDLQCPACNQYSQLIKALEQDPQDGKRIQENFTFVYRHFPLDSIHPHAREGAYAAEAAAEQGKFWEMHDLLFMKQEEWATSSDPEELLMSYATELELDVEAFKEAYSSSEIRDRVQTDYLSGLDVQVAATPTFFVNGTKLENPASIEEFKQILLSELDKE